MTGPEKLVAACALLNILWMTDFVWADGIDVMVTNDLP